jgi:outer membrane protein assembly factor BamB
VDPEDGVFIFSSSATRERWGYSLTTGQLLWGPSEPEPQLNFYAAAPLNIYQGMLLTPGIGGVLTAYNIKTGQILWKYTAKQVGFESPFGNYPLTISAIADGKIYLTNGEHSPTQPQWRGFLRAVNASNGVELWKILNRCGEENTFQTVAADGYILSLNGLDSQIYCFGKGPSAITANVQNDVITQGNTVLVKGTITDQSAGAKKIAQKQGLITGVAAVSDGDQQGWMEYLYMQQEKPTEVNGVPVRVTATDPNGNFQDLGTAVSDEFGNYAVDWTPPVPGTYTVKASFEGSASYYGSSTSTSFTVSEASTSQSTAGTSTEPIGMYILAATAIIVIAIAVVAVLILRKKA